MRIAREFVPPGEVIWLERYKVIKPRLRVAGMPAAAAATPSPNEPAAGAGSAGRAQQQAVASKDKCNRGSSSHHAAGQAAAAEEGGNSIRSADSATAARTYRPSSSGLVAALAAVPSAVAGGRIVSRLQPHFTDGLSLIVGGMVVSRNMFLDHVPDAQIAQLKRLVRWMQRQQARGRLVAGSAAGAGAAGSTAPPLQQAMPQRQPVVQFAV